MWENWVAFGDLHDTYRAQILKEVRASFCGGLSSADSVQTYRYYSNLLLLPLAFETMH